MKKITKYCALLCLTISLSSWAIPSYADNGLGQTLQINTRFHSVVGTPVWLLVIRDADTGVVVPYMFDIKNNDNFWIAFSYNRNYIITASNLKFGPFAIIPNFCHLESKVISGKSMIITLTGDLTPSRNTTKCNVLKYNDSAFPLSQGTS